MSDFLKLSDSLDLWVKTLRTYIDAELVKSCENLKNDVPARLCSAMAYSLTAPGKRLRPLLVCLGGIAPCGRNLSLDFLRELTPAALSVEMIHAYSLIHDDLPAMDNDDFRRGRPTNHRKFDEATAILAGDALQTLAFETLGRTADNPSGSNEFYSAQKSLSSMEKAVNVFRILSHGAGSAGMAGGQMDDMLFTPDARRPVLPLTLFGCFPGISAEFCQSELKKFGDSSWKPELRALESMQDRKTGALIASAVMMGAVLGDATEEQLFRLGMYGQYLGLMFQITDDILDATSTTETMGKKVGKDDEKGKTTWVNHLGIADSCHYVERLAALAREEIEADGIFPEVQILSQLLDFIANRKH